ncbi:MAG: tRNA pseudouridine(55) synthase TruB [Rickettsiales bacterium]|nr:MAG: tRNA pseudouridine(55) synthase TruB [Rickettsiales bacterium]
MNSWLNIYKPRGISSAHTVAMVKKAFREYKVGHTGTLDLEAEGVLPMAIGEATKLVSILIDAKKQYQFTVKFGAKTDTADNSGKIIDSCEYIPTKKQCEDICAKFLGEIAQIPPAYSALKVNGVRAYKLARDGKEVELKKRYIEIYDLQCIAYDESIGTATYICVCSKGTYIRTLAEDISLALQSLGYVIELRRLRVGMFDMATAVNISNCATLTLQETKKLLLENCLKIESVLDDIPVLEADETILQKIRFGQPCLFEGVADNELIWIRYNSRIVAIGSLISNNFKSSRVFNLNYGE